MSFGIKNFFWGKKKSVFENQEKFSIKRIIFKAAVFLCSLLKIKRLEDFFQEKLKSLDEVKEHVLSRYIVKELFLYFIVCFAFFFVVFFVNQILLMAETILKKRVPVSSVARLILYCLPAVVAQSAPYSTLVGFLMCLGHLVTDNEILIIRASGYRYSMILKPVILMGILISIFSFIMNDYFLPLGTLHYNRLLKQIVVSNPAIELEPNSVKRLNDSTLVIGNVAGQNVSDLVFFDTGTDGEKRIIISKNTEIKKSKDEGVLMQLNMNDADVIMLSKSNRRNFDVLDAEKLSLNVFEDSILDTSSGTSPREMTSWDLKKKIDDMKKIEGYSEKQMNTYRLEYNKKFSIPFGSIFFAILAFPLSLVFGKKDGHTLGLIFGLIISVMYWAANIIGQMFGIRSGVNGFWVMWGPNFFIGIVGSILYLRLRRK